LRLGLSEADERKRFSDLYAYVVEFVSLIQRENFVVSSAMIYLHKYYKQHSLINKLAPSSLYQSTLIAASCVFLAAKVCYVPVTLDRTVKAFFDIEKKKTPKI